MLGCRFLYTGSGDYEATANVFAIPDWDSAFVGLCSGDIAAASQSPEMLVLVFIYEEKCVCFL